MNSVEQTKVIERLEKDLAKVLKRVGYLERQVEALKEMHDSGLPSRDSMEVKTNWPK